MKCPFCEKDQLIVTNTRPTNHNLETWRRRKCLHCNEIITTHEKIDLSCLTVVKRSGQRVKYNRAKLLSGIYQAVAATKKMDRGTAGDISEKIMQEVEFKILSQKNKEIRSSEIFKITVEVLKERHPDSCLRYIAYFSKDSLSLNLLLQSF